MVIQDVQQANQVKGRSQLSRVAFIGNYLPAQCGIATFTTDLVESLASHSPDVTFIALPATDADTAFSHSDHVRFVIRKHDLDSYVQATHFLT
jgi:hypothetical protein